MSLSNKDKSFNEIQSNFFQALEELDIFKLKTAIEKGANIHAKFEDLYSKKENGLDGALQVIASASSMRLDYRQKQENLFRYMLSLENFDRNEPGFGNNHILQTLITYKKDHLAEILLEEPQKLLFDNAKSDISVLYWAMFHKNDNIADKILEANIVDPTKTPASRKTTIVQLSLDMSKEFFDKYKRVVLSPEHVGKVSEDDKKLLAQGPNPQKSNKLQVVQTANSNGIFGKPIPSTTRFIKI